MAVQVYKIAVLAIVMPIERAFDNIKLLQKIIVASDKLLNTSCK